LITSKGYKYFLLVFFPLISYGKDPETFRRISLGVSYSYLKIDRQWQFSDNISTQERQRIEANYYGGKGYSVGLSAYWNFKKNKNILIAAGINYTGFSDRTQTSLDTIYYHGSGIYRIIHWHYENKLRYFGYFLGLQYSILPEKKIFPSAFIGASSLTNNKQINAYVDEEEPSFNSTKIFPGNDSKQINLTAKIILSYHFTERSWCSIAPYYSKPIYQNDYSTKERFSLDILGGELMIYYRF
jgi:hypothetical protein